VITGAALTFPDFTGTASGIPVKVSFHANGLLNGDLDLASGAMNIPSTGTSNYTAVVQLTPPTGAVCTYDPIPLKFTTSGGSPIAGVPFTVANGASVSTNHGSEYGELTSTTFPPTGGCGTIDQTTAAGQLALGTVST
jgi:hypothetical protein